MGEIGHQILDNVHVVERIDSDGSLDILDRTCAGEPVRPVDVHCAAATYALTAGSPKGQRRIDVILDCDQGVEDHRAAAVKIDVERIQARPVAAVGIKPIDAIFARAFVAGRLVLERPGLPLNNFGIPGQGELDHGVSMPECG